MSVWIPGLIVVAVGLVAGLWFAFRGKGEAPEEGTPGAAPAATAADPAAPRRAAAAPGIAPPSSERRAGLVGFIFGVATCVVVGGLVYWATQGSRPRDDMDSGAAMPPMQGRAQTGQAQGPGAPGAADAADAADTAHEESAELTPEVAAQLEQLRARVLATPQDLDARRQLTVALLNANLLMEAFEQARELQKVAPNDPDGLFVEGVVRLAMGQWPLTVELMDGVLAQHPDHLLAALAKGQAQASLGETAQAIATLNKGLAAAGGSFPPIEELLAQLGAGGETGRADMGGTAAPASAFAPPGTAASEAAATPASTGGGSYRVHVELAPGTVAPSSANGVPPTLFLALRGEAPGPPAAVKRIVDPTFPLDLTLSAADSMMGQPLPQKGSLSVILDGDGNASTKEPGDLAAAMPATSGTPITVILERVAQ